MALTEYQTETTDSYGSNKKQNKAKSKSKKQNEMKKSMSVGQLLAEKALK